MSKSKNAGSVEREAIAKRVRAARKAAGLTQAALARRLGCCQAFVSQAETGASIVSEEYVRRVLDACKLDPEWGAPKPRDEGPRPLRRNEIAGIDPETFKPVGKNTPRDVELAGRYKWWKDRRDERVAIENARREAGMDPFDIGW